MVLRGSEILIAGLFSLIPAYFFFQYYKRRLIRELVRGHDNLGYEVDKRTRLLGQAIDELQLQKTQLNLITDSLPVLVAYFDRDIVLKFHNKVYRQWLGLNNDQSILGLHLSEIVGHQVFDMVKPKIQQALRGEPVTFETVVPYHDRIRSLNISYIPDKDHQTGEVRGYVVLASDVGQYKEIQANLTRAKEEAEAANRAKTSFLANMSHEIRTPLGAMLGFSDLLQASADGNSAANQDYIDAIRRNGSILSKVINNILDLSKIEAGRLDLENREIPISEVLTDVTSTLSLKAQEKGIELTINQDENVPQIIRTDSLRFRQILVNVVNNAVKFTNKGSVNVNVKFDRTKGLLIVLVQDTGIGMSAEQINKIFEPFQQADASLTRKFGGTGLGLVLAKKLAQRLGGDVTLVKSTVGVGSEFRIIIDPGPVRNLETKLKTTEVKPHKALQLNRQLAGMSVLLVDDAPDNRTMVRLFLELAGAAVDLACDGQEGVDKAAKKIYDVILMDLQMPVMDGYEATTLLRKRGFHGPIIAVTAHVFKEELQHCLAVGFDGHLSKPVEWQALIETLSSFKTLPIQAIPSEFQRCE